jgi:hypothetical protein
MYQYCSIAWYVQYLPTASIAHTAVCAILAKKQYCNAILDTTGIHASPGLCVQHVSDSVSDALSVSRGRTVQLCRTRAPPLNYLFARSDGSPVR